MLRPVGTEFDYCFPPDSAANKCVYTIFRYRVIGHDWVQRAAGLNEGFDPRDCIPYGEPYQAEHVEVIGKEEHAPIEWRPMNGRFVPVPPARCAELLGEKW